MKRARRLALLTAILAAVPALALAATHTRTHIYQAFTSAGKPRGQVTHTFYASGYNFSGCLGSDATARRDAWRCEVAAGFGVFVLDPCFSSAKTMHFVLCPASGPWNSKLIKVKLTSRLSAREGNRGKPSTHGLPWALVTVKGWRCHLKTGATNRVHGQRQNYFCKGTSRSLWGSPQRGSEPWKIYVAGNHPMSFQTRTGIKAAWF